MSEHHTFLDGKLHIYRRENSSYWQCSAHLRGKNYRKSTKETSFTLAKEIAEDFYLELRGKARAGVLTTGPTFAKAAETFLSEYVLITQGQRSPVWVKTYRILIKTHIVPFFGKLPVNQITASKLQEYRLHRQKTGIERLGHPPARNSMHNEFVAIRQILKTALRHGWLTHLPDMSFPYKTVGKITRRAWFSPEQYQQLYEAVRRRITEQKRPHRLRTFQYEQLLDKILFVANTGLRPDEAMHLEFRDVQIVREPGSKQEILHLEIRGKRGIRYCKSTSQAVHPFKRLKSRVRPIANASFREGASLPSSTDKLFPDKAITLFNSILEEEGLKRDREGQIRTFYSLRHSYLSFRLLEGAEIWMLAKNCGTSPEMIDKHYASHIKDRLDAKAINVDRGNIARERRAKAAMG